MVVDSNVIDCAEPKIFSMPQQRQDCLDNGGTSLNNDTALMAVITSTSVTSIVRPTMMASYDHHGSGHDHDQAHDCRD